MLTIVGGGPGRSGLLTEWAVSALDRAETIFVEPEARQTLGDRADWLAKADVALSEHAIKSLVEFARREAAWLVPGTPALYAPVAGWLSSLDRQELKYIRVIPGVAHHTAALDRQGIFLSESVISVLADDGSDWLTWDDGDWDGPGVRHRVAWAQTRPLDGRLVVMFRGGARIARAVRWLEDWGARVEVCPVSRLADLTDFDEVDRAIRRMDRYDWVVFTSAEAVRRWFERAQRLGEDIRRLKAKIAVVGPETAMRVRELGFVPEVMPQTEYSQEGLVQAFRNIPLRGALILFPTGQLTRELLGDELRGRGALVNEVVLYQNQRVPLSSALYRAIGTEIPDAIMFTASSQVEYLIEQLAVEDRRHLANIPTFSIGPLTTRTLSHYGIVPVAEAPEPSLRLLTEQVCDYYTGVSGRG